MESLTRGQRRSEYMKQYRESHKEHIVELNKALYEKNKQAIQEKTGVHCACEICGGKFTIHHKTAHERSQKHQRALSLQ